MEVWGGASRFIGEEHWQIGGSVFCGGGRVGGAKNSLHRVVGVGRTQPQAWGMWLGFPIDS